MNIINKRKTNQIEAREIMVGACFLWKNQLYIRSNGTYNKTPGYSVSIVRLSDGCEDCFTDNVLVEPVGAIATIE